MIVIYLLMTVIGVTIIVTVYNHFQRKKMILNLWEEHETLNNVKNFHETFKYYYENTKKHMKDVFSVDDVTWTDLDMTRIYHNMNYTFTSVGEELLFYRLKKSHEMEMIDEETVQKITFNKEYRNDLSFILAGLGKVMYANSSKYMFYKPEYTFNKVYILFSVLPVVSVILMFFSLQVGIVLLLTSILLNVYLSYKKRNESENEFDSLFYALNVILASRKLAKLNNNQDILQQTEKLKKISFISVLLLKDDKGSTENIALQLMTLIKSYFLIDYFLFHYTLNLIHNNSNLYRELWIRLGELDCCYSIALWRNTLPYYCLPTFNQDKKLHVEEAYHPLLDKPIGNDFTFDGDVLLTGSNASGKSTFIKTVAINIILAQALNTSTSASISLQKGVVYSSMAVSDNIEKGQSYFLSEINALKRILDKRNVEKDAFMYVFLDEIFKGTNTIERIAAAESVLDYLHQFEHTHVMAATHDLELTNELSEKYVNYHFREQIVNDEIVFDYLIKTGPSKTKNAIELLRIIDFPREVYERAIEHVEEAVR